jgi:putative ABC transport system permease protein
MTTLMQDVRYGIRMLLQNPAFTAIAVITLALGIGANSAIFSVINSVLLRPLPYDESNRLVILWERSPQLDGMSIAYPNFIDWRNQNKVFEKIGVYRRQSYNLTGSGEPVQVLGGMVSADLFEALRIKPALGRTFSQDEDKPGGKEVVVLSYGIWQRKFGADQGVLGRTLSLDGKNYTVIGVTPEGFLFPSRVEIWTPVGQASGQQSWVNRGNHPGLYGLARLKSGVTIDQARADMESIAVHLEQQYPASNTSNRISVVPMLDNAVQNIRPSLYVLFGAVGLVLLIACVNVANLLLARSASRQREIAIRTALGAGRSRIIRQLLTESVLLALVGGGLGLALARWGVKLLVAVSPNSIPRASEIGLDGRVLLFTCAVSLLTGIVFGLVPAWQASKPDLNETLKESARGTSGGLRRQYMRSTLVVVEVAVALVLLIGGGLLIRSFYRLMQVNPGFRLEKLLSFSINLPSARYSQDQQVASFYTNLLDRLKALPGVESVAASSGLPLGNNGWQTSFSIEGRPEPEPGKWPLTEAAAVTPDYFTTMGMPLLKGRTFTDQDNRKDAPRVMIVDPSFSERYWPGEEVIGKTVRMGRRQNTPPTTIVGMVGRVKMEGLDNDSNRTQAYFPQHQMGASSMTIILRTTTDPLAMAAAARKQVAAIDPDQPIYSVKTIEQLRDDSVAPRRLSLLLLGVFAAVALTLASIGVYGVMSYSVTHRAHELGIRMALGAQRGDVVKLVTKEGMTLAGVGLVLGLAGAFGLTRLMSTMLFGVTATDPLTFGTISVFLGIVALLACYVPAHRATKIDPIVALRYE